MRNCESMRQVSSERAVKVVSMDNSSFPPTEPTVTQSNPTHRTSRAPSLRRRWLGAIVSVLCSACTLVPGTEMEMPEFIHDFDITYNGTPIQIRDETLWLNASVEDFPLDWPQWERATSAVDGRVTIGRLAPTLDIDAGGVDLDDDDRLCLKNPITIYEASTGDALYEIPAGTCLANEGRTVIEIDTN